ncbi:unnamed protein product [Prorocentrum cordatum]|uniref:Uncharacterized protein n=1 Tax=Prorocentrum cordatum TaxID=2364126 RepID=A0ABN9SB74_9DINO|nr:unnamed protein product [Polarella glacialis]
MSAPISDSFCFRSLLLLQEWADEFFGPGKGDARRPGWGLKTPVQLCPSATGVVFKFRPLATLSGVEFERLEEGGLEFIAERHPQGGARLRVQRCAYGWKATLKENSERAILRKFKEGLGKLSHLHCRGAVM